MYFAPGVGLVKITFRHSDGSTSTVEKTGEGARTRQPASPAPCASAARSLRGSRRALTLAAVLLGVSAAPAAAQIQPPSLTADTTFAFQGVSQYDFSAGVQEDVGLAAAVDDARGRTYAAGYTQVAGATQIAIVARRTDGSLDPSFAGDGSLELTQSRASLATDLAVLPDGRLRVLIRFDSASSGPPVYDVGTVGLLPDGSPDPDHGLVSFDAGTAADIGNAIAVAPDGRVAVAGGNGADSFAVGRRHPEHHRPLTERRRRGRGRRLGSLGAGAADRDADGRRGARGRRLRHGGHRPGRDHGHAGRARDPCGSVLGRGHDRRRRRLRRVPRAARRRPAEGSRRAASTSAGRCSRPASRSSAAG